MTADIPTLQEAYAHLPFSPQAWNQLFERYAEKHRHYHNLAHVLDCLDQLQRHRPGHSALQAAIWFHDVIYAPTSSRNEEASAELFLQLVGTSAPEQWCSWVHLLILATKHGANLVESRLCPEQQQEHDLLLDIDLSILASQPSRYDQYESQIRAEYGWVPWFLYRKKRRQILQHFLELAEQGRLFRTPFYRNQHPAAQDNLRRTLNI